MADAGKMKLPSVFELLIRIRLFVAALTVELEANARITAFTGENPFSRSQWRIVPEVLPVTAFQNRAPVVFVVFLKAGDLLFHWFMTDVRHGGPCTS